MLEKTENNLPKITIIGAGAAGFSAALTLAERGYKIELIDKATLSSGASGRNPGRMGHGFHYADIETAKAYLNASIKVQRTYPDYLLARDEPFSSPLRHGRYFITKNSTVPKEEILATYHAIKEEYIRLVKKDSANEVFGPPEDFFRILDPTEYNQAVNMNIVDIGIETAEHLFDWSRFSQDIKERIIHCPNITLKEHTEVTQIRRNPLGLERFTLETKTAEGEVSTSTTDYVINSTWQEIKRLNDQIGLTMVPGERTNRLKALLILELPESLENTNSMFFCMGQHCMISNMGQQRAMATYAPITNLETSTDLSLSKKAQRLLDNQATQEEKQEMGKKMLEGISHYIPEIAKAKVLDLKYGIIQTKGSLTLADLQNPTHSFNSRDDHCVKEEQLGLISNPCMKLFYFVENGELVADLIDSQVAVSKKIKACFKLIKEKAKEHHLLFDSTIQSAVIQHLEQFEFSSFDKNSIESIADRIVKTMRDKSNLFRFFPHNPGNIPSPLVQEETSKNYPM
ncbi:MULTISPECIES: FAD-dependent oxidoreductase [Legionella]|uniref:Bifunctional tRNA (Mnm(5)s(2)U34)-methyltransferase/FAD-dependent cmnm(5)s(2)U34 oxidoreductase n=1 Tax=Legionella drozanskii LLAP-1 TaxID=1212489 RepID=A0A0W0SXM0_9GAMM|nr:MULTISPECIES: FAD-dependent oxidoreductase [Legionella]KTC88073.1 bifunctional tRNA (mnm(5)s(2)U34)-methyltransferase/FAD-dependent cmnm(5)s(2)U34 oxidoreductase [Legionella drozanskii LLAP-1]PJE06751.1 MAG: FAD-dependent oxidoreductase [Legionella sp.]